MDHGYFTLDKRNANIPKGFLIASVLICSVLTFSTGVYSAQSHSYSQESVRESANRSKRDKDEGFKKWGLSVELDALDIFTVTAERRFKLFNSSNVLFKDSHIATGVVTNIMQSGFSIGPYIRISPIALFDVTFDVRYVYEWFGLSFVSPYEDISGAVIEDKISNKEFKSAQGIMLRIIPMLRFKIGPVLFMYTFILYYLNLDHSDVYFNHYYGHLQKDGFDYINSFGLGFFLKENIILGFLQSISHADDAGYNEYTASCMLIITDINFISKEDMFKLACHYVYKSKNKITGFISRTKGLNFSVSYQINLNWR